MVTTFDSVFQNVEAADAIVTGCISGIQQYKSRTIVDDITQLNATTRSHNNYYLCPFCDPGCTICSEGKLGSLLQPVSSFAIPQKLVDDAARAEKAALQGFFPDINRMFATADGNLYLLKLDSNEIQQHDQTILEVIYDNYTDVIMAVCIATPAAGDYAECVTHLLLVATTAEVVVYTIEYNFNNDSIQVKPTSYSVALDDAVIVKMVCCPTSHRIFASATDGCVYELMLQSRQRNINWLNTLFVNGNDTADQEDCKVLKCSRVCNSASQYSLLGLFTFTDYDDCAMHLCVHQQSLLAMSSKGVLHIHHIDDKRKHVSTFRTHDMMVEYINRTNRSNPQFHSAELLDPVVSTISVIESPDSTKNESIEVVVVFQSGVRCYVTFNVHLTDAIISAIRLPPGFVGSNASTGKRIIAAASIYDKGRSVFFCSSDSSRRLCRIGSISGCCIQSEPVEFINEENSSNSACDSCVMHICVGKTDECGTMLFVTTQMQVFVYRCLRPTHYFQSLQSEQSQRATLLFNFFRSTLTHQLMLNYDACCLCLQLYLQSVDVPISSHWVCNQDVHLFMGRSVSWKLCSIYMVFSNLVKDVWISDVSAIAATAATESLLLLKHLRKLCQLVSEKFLYKHVFDDVLDCIDRGDLLHYPGADSDEDDAYAFYLWLLLERTNQCLELVCTPAYALLETVANGTTLKMMVTDKRLHEQVRSLMTTYVCAKIDSNRDESISRLVYVYSHFYCYFTLSDYIACLYMVQDNDYILDKCISGWHSLYDLTNSHSSLSYALKHLYVKASGTVQHSQWIFERKTVDVLLGVLDNIHSRPLYRTSINGPTDVCLDNRQSLGSFTASGSGALKIGMNGLDGRSVQISRAIDAGAADAASEVTLIDLCQQKLLHFLLHKDHDHSTVVHLCNYLYQQLKPMTSEEDSNAMDVKLKHTIFDKVLEYDMSHGYVNDYSGDGSINYSIKPVLSLIDDEFVLRHCSKFSYIDSADACRLSAYASVKFDWLSNRHIHMAHGAAFMRKLATCRDQLHVSVRINCAAAATTVSTTVCSSECEEEEVSLCLRYQQEALSSGILQQSADSDDDVYNLTYQYLSEAKLLDCLLMPKYEILYLVICLKCNGHLLNSRFPDKIVHTYLYSMLPLRLIQDNGVEVAQRDAWTSYMRCKEALLPSPIRKHAASGTWLESIEKQLKYLGSEVKDKRRLDIDIILAELEDVVYFVTRIIRLESSSLAQSDWCHRCITVYLGVSQVSLMDAYLQVLEAWRGQDDSKRVFLIQSAVRALDALVTDATKQSASQDLKSTLFSAIRCCKFEKWVHRLQTVATSIDHVSTTSAVIHNINEVLNRIHSTTSQPAFIESYKMYNFVDNRN